MNFLDFVLFCLVLTLNNSFLLRLLKVWYLYVFLHFLWFFANCIIHQLLKKIFFKTILSIFLSSVFISMYGSSRAFWLNLMVLCHFSNTNQWYNACFKLLMCITYSLLSCKLATNSLNFLIYILLRKKSKTFKRLCNFSEYWTKTSRKYSSSLSSL